MVPNWSISRNCKEIWNSTKISVTPGVYLTRGGSVQRLLTYVPGGGRPAPPCSLSQAGFAVTLSKRRYWGIPCWRLMEVGLHGWSATTWCVTDLTKSVTPPWTPISPLPVQIKATHTTYSSPLVKVSVSSSSSTGEALSGVKSRVKHLLELQK
jgi:hypothetical protein